MEDGTILVYLVCPSVSNNMSVGWQRERERERERELKSEVVLSWWPFTWHTVMVAGRVSLAMYASRVLYSKPAGGILGQKRVSLGSV